MLDTVSDDAFARYVKQTGMATPEQIETARKQAPLPLADALVKLGVITALQRETVEKKLEAQREGVGELAGCKLIRKIGEGGMGAVYLAEDTARRRKVAIKVLPKKHAADAEFLKRFRREVEAVTALDHPNIVQAYSAGEDHGYHFFVMEYCEGESLRKRVERLKVLPAADACGLVLQVARGLKHAHDHGFIHRDVKPENLISTPAGVVKILDLGLAKNLEDTQATFRTVTGAALGTPHYISPEQARGDKDVDGRSDLYSLGATFYHLVTGQVPFHGSSIFEIIQKHLMEQLPDPRDVRPEIPETVVHVIRKLLAKAPADRYRDCAELIQDLDRLAAREAPLTPPVEASLSSVALPRNAIPARPEARRTGRVIGGAAAAVLLIGILAYAVWPTTTPTAPTPELPKKPVAPLLAKNDPPAVEKANPEPEKPEPAKPEPARPEPEPVKPDLSAEAKDKSAKAEPVRPEPDPAKPEPAKPELVKGEPARPEPAKPELEPAKPVKFAVPLPANRSVAESAFKAQFKEDVAKTAAADKAAFAKKLLALEPASNPADLYHRLLNARDLAAQGGDLATALAAVDRLNESFVIDAFAFRVDALVACTSRTTEGAAALARAFLTHIDEAVQIDQYDVAARLVAKGKDPVDKSNSDEIKSAYLARSKFVGMLKTEFAAAAAAARTRIDKPDDPAANTQMGRFLCFAKEDWDRGLPMLAKGLDASLKSLAEKDLSSPDGADLQKDLCEGWLLVAEKETSKVRKDNVTARARFWFDQVESKLLPADRPKIAKRLDQLEKNAAPRTGVPKPAGSKTPDYLARFELLSRVAPDHMARFRGNWRLQNGALVSSLEGDNQRPTLIHLPVALQEEYDLVIEAQRLAGTEDIVFGLASLKNEFGMGLDGWRGESAGLNGPNGTFSWQRAGRGGVFNDRKVHSIRFEVRKTGAVLRVDEEPIITLTDYRQSSIPAAMTEGKQPPGAVSIATVRTSFRITKVTYLPIRSR